MTIRFALRAVMVMNIIAFIVMGWIAVSMVPMIIEMVGAQAVPTPVIDERVSALETRVTILEGVPAPTATSQATTAPSTATPEPTATATPSLSPVPPTPTSAIPPTSTPAVAVGWHPAGSHGANVHEHGDAPPAWVVTSANPPFTQTRESHTGYKGVYDVSPGGVESYLIGHIISTEFARSHGDHDYQLWLRDPETGEVFYVAGIMNFGNPGITDPIPERLSDTGERPIALSVNDGGCETWYNRPGANPMDVGWTICGRFEKFSGAVTGGVGTFRTIDWVIPCSRLPAGNPMLNNCRVEFGVARLSFIVNSREYGVPGITPIN